MNRLKVLRNRANITLRDLSKYISLRNATISDIENGKQPMREIHVQKLTSFFDVTSDYLLGYSNSGLGIYFSDDDHTYISESEANRIQESNIIKEELIHHASSDWVIKEPSTNIRIYRGEYSIFRSVDMSKENANISESTKQEIINELARLDERELEKVLKFINEYIK